MCRDFCKETQKATPNYSAIVSGVMCNEMKNIYSLAKDVKKIAAIQEATLNTDKYGVSTNHGLFGSNEWWNSISSGSLETRTVEGEISRVYMTGHNDFPQFDIDSDGVVTSWIREGKEKLYLKGSQIKLEYVLTKNRFDHTESPTIINVYVSK